MAYREDGPPEKAVELLEHVVTVEGGFLHDDHPDQLASLAAYSAHILACRGTWWI
jgi:hypothetical protein